MQKKGSRLEGMLRLKTAHFPTWELEELKCGYQGLFQEEKSLVTQQPGELHGLYRS
jgi:hypothetical protein